MAKVIISFLGTGGYSDKNKSRGEYRKTKYSIGDKEFPCEFVTEALWKNYGADKIIYIGTLKSMWEVVYDNKTFVNNQNDMDWEKLANIVEQSTHKTNIEPFKTEIENIFRGTIITPVILKYGLNDEENEFNIRRLFEIEKYLDSGDKLFIDISHSFRSLPIVLINVLNFIIENSNKKLAIENISYGMFEVSSEMNDVSPIVNLNIIKELNANILAAHEFSEYGNAYLFSQLLEKTDKSLSSVLQSFSDSKSLNHIYDLRNKIQQLKGQNFEKLNAIQKATLPKAVNDFVGRFKNAKKDSHFQFELAKWMFDHKEYGTTAIALIESLITKVCELEKLNPTEKKDRECAKQLINLAGKYAVNIKKEAKKSSNDVCLERMLLQSKSYSSFHALWGDTNKIRKSVAHSIGTKTSVKKMILDLNTNIKEAEKLIYMS